MRKLSDAVAHLAAMRTAMAGPPLSTQDDRLHDLEDFGSNPGNLRARIYVPDGQNGRSALVVVLHGCTQTAAGYNVGSGWSRLADEHGFTLLFPEQRRANNPNLCFNWFSPEDTARDGGEALSIRQMVATLTRDHRIDHARVFITGLSAGGAMACVMLATYPEVFSGGAIIAGLPFGCASSVPEALDRMRGHGGAAPGELGAAVRRASAHQGPWPTISVWHGTADTTVSPANAEAIIAQWRSVHAIDEAPSTSTIVDGHQRRAWRDAAGREVIEAYRISGMGHGTPLDALGDGGCGAAGPYMLQANISSTQRIAAFWGLTDDKAAVPKQRAELLVPAAGEQTQRPGEAPPKQATSGGGVQGMIEGALRAAGLMR